MDNIITQSINISYIKYNIYMYMYHNITDLYIYCILYKLYILYILIIIIIILQHFKFNYFRIETNICNVCAYINI